MPSNVSSDASLNLLPVDPVFLTWEGLSVTAKKTERILLKDVSGIAQPGQLIALMGASGAGKTTLLNALLQRNVKGLKISGTVKVNGQVSAYIQQQNLFIKSLTVYEHLNLQAALRLPSSFTKYERELRVKQVIADLELERCIDSRIGVSGVEKGITSGEAKRLSFATEILTNPSLLFADEPTTGIDSFMAYHIVKVLERMASENGKTIICTIHQPASDTFEMFDRVIFLANGKIAFLGSPSEALLFYGDIGYPIPAHTNPADFFIQTLAIVPGEEEKCIERANRIINAFMKSKYEVRMRQYLELGSKHFQAQLVEHAKASIPTLIRALFVRSFKQNLRNPIFLWAKLIQKVVMGLFLGTLYLKTEMNQDGIISIRGALFYYISELTYSTVLGIQTFLPADFPLLVREYHDGIYPVICYYLSMIMSYLPIFTIDGMCMVCISYYLIGLHPTFATFLITLLICILIEWSALSVGIMLSSISPSYAIAVSISGPLLTVLSITGGLYSNIKTIPESVGWIQYFSWFRFGYESLIINEFSHYDNISCLLSSGKHTAICENSGKSVIDNLNFEISNMHMNMGVMLFYILCVFIIGYIGLVLRVQLAR
uniref:ABC transporter domain-containing protein n=1 Tax=Elaeophora elaphi TaxID=1147741 RepID=A0A0R3RI40_9BILA